MAVSVTDANYVNLKQRLKKALRLIDYRPEKETLVLKPNCASAYGHYLLGDYTSPQLVEAFINLFPDRNYIIAEGSAVGMNFFDSARLNGYNRLADRYTNVKLVDLEKEERVALDWKYGKIDIPKLVLENEYINFPKMKTHNLCTVTLGMKNQKGLLDEKTKKKFHWMDIHDAIRQLENVISPDLTIMDGIIALEGNGPNSIIAKQKLMGVIVAGQDVVELDNACISLMGIPPESVMHVPRMDIRVVGRSIKSCRKEFEMPLRDNGYLRFGNVYYTLGCSGCLESLSGGLRGMAALSELPKLPERAVAMLNNILLQRMYLFMGKENVLPDRKCKMICIGNCTKHFADRNGLQYIPGCPPSAESLTSIFD